MGGQVIMTKAKEILNSGIEQGLEQGLEQGIEQGIEQGKIQIIVDLVKDEVLSLEEAAKRAGITVDELKAKMNSI